MATAKETILSSAKGLLELTGTTKDVILNHYIDMVLQAVMDYCNRSDFPDALIPFATSKVIAMYKNDGGSATGSAGNGSVKSIKSGDVSYSFAGDEVNRGFSGVAVGEFSAGEKSQLSRYRQLGFK